MYTTYVPGAQGGQKRVLDPCNGMMAAMWALGTKLRSSARVASAELQRWVVSQPRNMQGVHSAEPTQRKHKCEHTMIRRSTEAYKKDLLFSVT